MLIKFFKGDKNFSNPNFAMRYLLREKSNHNDNDKKHMRVLRGDPNKSLMIANSLDFTQKYKMGCLSFEEANLSDEDKQQIMDRFEAMAFCGLDADQYDITWIEHTDKGRLELNFFSPAVELTTGKRYQMYYHRADQKTFSLWRDVINHDFGLSDPLDPSKRQTLTQSDKRVSKKAQERKDFYAEQVKELYRTQTVNNRDELIKHFTQNGLGISRIGKDYITLIDHNNTKIRLKGGLFEPNPEPHHFDTTADKPEPPYTHLNEHDTLEMLHTLSESLSERLYSKFEYNTHRYPKNAVSELLDASMTFKQSKKAKTHDKNPKHPLRPNTKLLERVRDLHHDFGGTATLHAQHFDELNQAERQIDRAEHDIDRQERAIEQQERQIDTETLTGNPNAQGTLSELTGQGNDPQGREQTAQIRIKHLREQITTLERGIRTATRTASDEIAGIRTGTHKTNTDFNDRMREIHQYEARRQRRAFALPQDVADDVGRCGMEARQRLTELSNDTEQRINEAHAVIANLTTANTAVTPQNRPKPSRDYSPSPF